MMGNRYMADAMRAARAMVGLNEQQMAREEALTVFKRHGGAFDRDGAPINGMCVTCHPTIVQPCSIQRLAFSLLLMQSTFDTSVDVVVDKVLTRIGELVRQNEDFGR